MGVRGAVYPEYFLELYSEEDERAESGIDMVPEEKPEETHTNLPDLEEKPEEAEEESANKPKEKVDDPDDPVEDPEPEVLPHLTDPSEEVSPEKHLMREELDDEVDAADDEAWCLSHELFAEDWLIKRFKASENRGSLTALLVHPVRRWRHRWHPF